MNVFNNKVVLSLVLIGLQACSSIRTTGVAGYAPAIRINTTTESQIELQKVVANSLGTPSVQLMKKVLTKKSTFYVEKNRLLGFDLDQPTVFQLLKDQHRCVLLNRKTKKIYGLTKVECIAL